MKLLDHLMYKTHQHHRKPSEPNTLVCRIHDHLLLVSNPKNHQNKASQELHRLLKELHFLLHGDADTEPDPKACSEAALEFFKGNRNATFRLLLKSFPELEYQSKTLTSQVVINLMGQHLPSSSLLIAAEYFEQNMDLVDFFISGLFDLAEDGTNVSLLYGFMLRECLRRSQTATKHVLDSQRSMKRFLECVLCPNYTFAAHVQDTVNLLLTRHKTVVADFLSREYEWFFEEFNSKLLVSSNRLTKSWALKLLAEILLEEKNHNVMVKYVGSVENLKIHMNALKEGCQLVQLEAFHVFKLFVQNSGKPKGVSDVLRLNKAKLLRFMDGLQSRTQEDESFEVAKAGVIREISKLEDIDCNPISLAGQLRFFTMNTVA